jgi:small subunit ribosomal protein S11
MGKKRIIQKSEEELLKEREALEKKMSKEAKVGSPSAIEEGRVYIFSSYNNTIISLTNYKGDVLAQKSAGGIGFKGTKKSTPYAASKVAEALGQIAKKLGITKISVIVKGIGPGRDSALRSLINQEFEIASISDVTPIPHNGCRPPRPRRL